VALLLLGTVACVFSAEHTGAVELGEASAGQSDVADMSGAKVAKGKDPRDELMTPWDKQGLKVIDAYANYNAKLQDDEKGLRKKLANPPDKSEGLPSCCSPVPPSFLWGKGRGCAVCENAQYALYMIPVRFLLRS